MPVFASADSLYQRMRPVFERIAAETPTALQGLAQARLIVRLTCTAPAAAIILNGRQTPVRVDFGANAVRPDLDVTMPADVLHHLLMDALSTKKAMANGQIKVKGPPWKMPVLIDVIRAARRFYPAGG